MKITLLTKTQVMKILEQLERNFDVYTVAKMIRYLINGISEMDSYLMALILMKQLEYIGDQLFDQEDYWGE